MSLNLNTSTSNAYMYEYFAALPAVPKLLYMYFELKGSL